MSFVIQQIYKILDLVSNVNNIKNMIILVILKYPRHWNTGLVSSGVSFNSWGEGASLALVDHPSSDGVTIKISYGVDVY